MCKYCDYDSEFNQVYQDGLTGDFYWEIRTSEWDEYDDDWVYEREYISWCPYCGRDLYHERSCSTCKFSASRGRLYACLNTEINLSSNQSDKFCCNKWEPKEEK